MIRLWIHELIRVLMDGEKNNNIRENFLFVNLKIKFIKIKFIFLEF